MPEGVEQPDAHFWVRFDDKYAAILFQLDVLHASQATLEQNRYTIVSKASSPADDTRCTVDISVQNCGGPVKEEVIAEYLRGFQGVQCMGPF